jgi:hypothetical protein
MISNLTKWFLCSQVKISGIKCDRCEWKDISVKFKEYKHYVNKPCPLCGDNLLTEKHYKLTKNITRFTTVFNILYFPVHISRMIFSKKYRNEKLIRFEINLKNMEIINRQDRNQSSSL